MSCEPRSRDLLHRTSLYRRDCSSFPQAPDGRPVEDEFIDTERGVRAHKVVECVERGERIGRASTGENDPPHGRRISTELRAVALEPCCRRSSRSRPRRSPDVGTAGACAGEAQAPAGGARGDAPRDRVRGSFPGDVPARAHADSVRHRASRDHGRSQAIPYLRSRVLRHLHGQVRVVPHSSQEPS